MKLETKAFNDGIKKMLKRFPNSASVVLKKFALDLLARIVHNTPVDTGRARAAWYPSMVGLGFNYDLNTEGTKPSEVAKGKKEGSFKDKTKNKKFMYIDLINSVKYIIYLEYGYSKKAPYGMVRISMRQMRGGKLPENLRAPLRMEWKRAVTYFPG